MSATPPLVAVAHGSRDPAAAEATQALLAAVRAARPGLDVRAAYLDHAEPRLASVLGDFGPAAVVVVVPLLLGAAYHSEIDVPSEMRAAAGRAVRSDVLGPDPMLLGALERRLAEAGIQGPDPGTAVVLAAAGSASAAAVAGVRGLAHDWGARGWWAVEAGFASVARPTVAEAVEGLLRRGAPRVAVASYLLFPGLFAASIATAAKSAGAVAVSAPLADAPEVAAVVLARYASATTRAGT